MGTGASPGGTVRAVRVTAPDTDRSSPTPQLRAGAAAFFGAPCFGARPCHNRPLVRYGVHRTMAKADIDLGKYQLGWSDTEADYVFKPKKGLNEAIIREMSAMKGEPAWMLEFPPMKTSARGFFASVLIREATVPACSI